MKLNIILDSDIILDLLSRSPNESQRALARLKKSSVCFWIPCCLFPFLEDHIHSVEYHPLETLLNQVQLLSSLSAHWRAIPPKHPHKIQALMSLDASVLPGQTLIWTNNPDFESVHPDIEAGDEQLIYGLLAMYDDENTITINGLMDQQQQLRSLLEQNLFAVLKHGKYVEGPEVELLERELAVYIGSKHCITVANSFEAMLIALMAVGVRAGDEVVTSPFASGSTAQAIMLLGAKPVFVDVSSRTYNINPDLIESVMNHRTRAIVPVNLFGQCADVFVINALANKYYLPVIEDATHSFGATYHERYAGTLSAIGCTSFSPTALLGTYGEGGACFTDDDQLAELIRQLRSLGQTKKYYCQSTGLSTRMNTLQASILLGKLPHFAQEIEQRVRIANIYNQQLEGQVKTPIIESHNTSVYAQYVIQINNRDQIHHSLQKQGIPTEIHYPIPLHLQPAFAYLHKEQGSFPVAESVAKRVLSLPLHPYLTEDAVTRVVDTLREMLS